MAEQKFTLPESLQDLSKNSSKNTPQGSTIESSTDREREKRRRRRELGIAAAILLVIIFATWLELSYFEASSFMAVLFYFNFILLLIVLFIVLRNAIKLVIERRSGVIGSRLRTRLAVSFMVLSLVPASVVYLAASRVVEASLDFWFRGQVEDSLNSAVDLAQTVYRLISEELRTQGNEFVVEAGIKGISWTTETLQEPVNNAQLKFGASLVMTTDSQLVPLAHIETHDATGLWEQLKDTVVWEEVTSRHYSFVPVVQGTNNYGVGLFAVDGGATGFLIIGKNVGQGTLEKLQEVVNGAKEYRQLKGLKPELKSSFLISLGVLCLVIILGAFWVGLRHSKELIVPILALAEGTQRIAKGDLAFRIEEGPADELGLLVRSFNSMAQDLKTSREQLINAYDLLSQQNAEMIGHNQYIETVLNTITSGVITLDESGNLATLNKIAQEIFEVRHFFQLQNPFDTPEGHNDVNVFIQSNAEYKELFQSMYQAVFVKEERVWHREVLLKHADAEQKFFVTAVGLATPERGVYGVVGVFEDVTELERVHRMAAWREVARRIAHEIKNPLTPIKLSAQRLEKKFGKQVEDPVFTQCTSLIVAQVERLQEMVSEFSTFAKLPEVELHKGSIEPLLRDLIALLKHGHPHIMWDYTADAAVPELKLDEQAMHRVFLNILTNAIEAVEGIARPRIAVAVRYDALLHQVRVDVSDNGIGLTEEEKTKLFEPYFSRKKGGTGLGLAIVRSVVSDHFGYVRISTGPAKETVMSVELPVGL